MHSVASDAVFLVSKLPAFPCNPETDRPTDLVYPPWLVPSTPISIPFCLLCVWIQASRRFPITTVVRLSFQGPALSAHKPEENQHRRQQKPRNLTEANHLEAYCKPGLDHGILYDPQLWRWPAGEDEKAKISTR